MPRTARISIGDVFGRYAVIARSARPRFWVCRCSCGTQREVTTSNLKGGHSTSCGCTRMQHMHEAATIHGHAGKPTYEYLFWQEMKKLCSNEGRISFPRYGGRGIKVHNAWLESFARFLEDVGERPSQDMVLSRKNKKKDFKPGNLEWTTTRKQQLRKSNARYVTINGETKQLQEWADAYGIKKSTLHWRLAHLPPERWLEKPNDAGRPGA